MLTSIGVGSGHACGIMAQKRTVGVTMPTDNWDWAQHPASSVIPLGVDEPNGWTAIEIRLSRVAKAPVLCLRIQAPLASIVGVMVHKVH